MLKSIIFCAVAVAMAFLMAGVSLNTFGRRLRIKDITFGDGDAFYSFWLGAWLVPALGFSAIYSVAKGNFTVAVVSLIIVAVGVATVIFSLKKLHCCGATDGGGNCKRPIGSHFDEQENCENGDGVPSKKSEWTENERFWDGITPKDGEREREIASVSEELRFESANNGADKHKLSVVLGLVLRDPTKKAAVFGAIFVISLAVAVLFAVFTNGQNTVSGDVYSSETVFDTYNRTGNAIFLSADGGAATYTIFGYATEYDGIDGLIAAIDGGRRFTVRYTVMDSDEWSNYFCLLGATDDEGNVYLDENAVTSAREWARTEKVICLSALSLLCGCVSVFYVAATVRERRKNGG